MTLSDSTTALARDAIADMIFSLSGAKAFHYVINPETHEHAFSLCKRFGISVRDYKALTYAARLANIDKNGTYKIEKQQWIQFLIGGRFVFIRRRSRRRENC